MATEYSFKFEESMTEDEIEERSFRSLLPSEAHRRGNKEKKLHNIEAEDDGAIHNSALMSGTGSQSTSKVKGQFTLNMYLFGTPALLYFLTLFPCFPRTLRFLLL